MRHSDHLKFISWHKYALKYCFWSWNVCCKVKR